MKIDNKTLDKVINYVSSYGTIDSLGFKVLTIGRYEFSYFRAGSADGLGLLDKSTGKQIDVDRRANINYFYGDYFEMCRSVEEIFKNYPEFKCLVDI